MAGETNENGTNYLDGSDFLNVLDVGFFLRQLGLRALEDIGRASAAWDYGLTRHEIRLIEWIATGLDNNQIAERAGIADVNTVKKQISLLFKKLGVARRPQVAAIATFYRVVTPAVAPRLHERVKKPGT